MLTAKEMLFADFLDMHLDLIFSELFTHIQGETHRHVNTQVWAQAVAAVTL